MKRTRKKNIQPMQATVEQTTAADKSVSFLRKLLPQLTGWICFLISISFLTLTFDSAHIKLTLCQIGATLLLTAWGALKISERKNPFSPAHLKLLLPFLIYAAWQILAWALFPYKYETADAFIKFLFYGGTIALITCEFSQEDIKTVTKFIMAAAWVSFSYGILQVLAIWWPSVDFLPWNGFFVKRVFSTHANPNFFGDFIIFTSCLMGACYLKTRAKNLLVLLSLGFICLVFSETKGAWLAYAAAAVFFAFGYTNFLASGLKKHKFFINLAAGVLLATALIFTAVYTFKRYQSVSFRAHTWAAAVEMVKKSPLLGTGLGSFKVVYPTYRHPQIFYIENAHNTETQHAENEFLEQAVVGGLVGFFLFLGMFVFLFYKAYQRIKETQEPTLRFLLLGYASAVFGMLVHSTVDISLHFVSSGFLMAVFIGSILALCGPEKQREKIPAPVVKYPYVLWVAKILCAALFVTAAVVFAVRFYGMTHTLTFHTFGNFFMGAAAWLGFLFCVGGVFYIVYRVLAATQKVSVVLLWGLAVWPCWIFFNFFAANHYYSVGVALTRLQTYNGALEYFTKAITFDPLQTEYRQYRANVYGTELDLSRRFVPAYGDTAPRTDYERAIEDLKTVLKRAPNHALIHQDIANLYYTTGVRMIQRSQTAHTRDEFNAYQQSAAENMALAKEALRRALEIDPVNENTYLLLASMALMAHDTQTAQHWLDAYRQGPANVTEEEFLARHKNNPRIEALQAQLDALRAQLEKKAKK